MCCVQSDFALDRCMACCLTCRLTCCPPACLFACCCRAHHFQSADALCAVDLPPAAGGGILAATFDTQGVSAWLLPPVAAMQTRGLGQVGGWVALETWPGFAAPATSRRVMHSGNAAHTCCAVVGRPGILHSPYCFTVLELIFPFPFALAARRCMRGQLSGAPQHLLKTSICCVAHMPPSPRPRPTAIPTPSFPSCSLALCV